MVEIYLIGCVIVSIFLGVVNRDQGCVEALKDFAIVAVFWPLAFCVVVGAAAAEIWSLHNLK